MDLRVRDNMGEVVITARILPDSPEVDVAAWVDKIKSIVAELEGELLRAAKKPVAFGLNVLEIVFKIPDKGGLMDKVESGIRSMEHVSDFTVTDMGRPIEDWKE